MLAGALASADDTLVPVAPPVEVDRAAAAAIGAAADNGGMVKASGQAATAGADTRADLQGNPGTSSNMARPSASPSAAAKINPDGTLTVKGRAKPGSTVTTTFPDGSTGSAVAGPDGSYQITSSGSVLKPAVARPLPAQPPANAANAAAGAVTPQPASPAALGNAPQGSNLPGATVPSPVDSNAAANAHTTPPATTPPAAVPVPVVPPAADSGAVPDASTASGGAPAFAPAPAPADKAPQTGKAANAATGKAPRVNNVPPTAAVKANADGTITITGKAKPGSTVTTTFPDGSTGTAKANDDGYYSITSGSGSNAQAEAAPAIAPEQPSSAPAQAQIPDQTQTQAQAEAHKPASTDDGSVLDAAALSADLSQKAGKDDVRRLDTPIPEGPLTLDGAVLLAVSRHPSVTSQIATIAQATGGIDMARAGYYPQVTIGTGSGTNYVPGQGNSTANTVSMQISQMIYDFGKVSETVDQARATVRREEANLLQQISKIEQQTAEAVINAHRYQTLVNIAAQQVDAVQQVYQMAKLRATSGVSSRADPVQAETRLQSAQATMIAVKSLNDQTRQHLRTLVGGPVTGEIALPLADERVSAIKLDPSQDPDTSEMPGVLVAQANELIAKTQLEIAKAQMLPTLTLNYTQTKNVSGLNTTTYVDKGSNHALSVGLQWTAFQGGALAAQVRSAEHAVNAARLTVASARLDGSDAARGYRDQALGAYSRLDKLAERRASIEETRNLYREQYKLGSRSILDLLNAEQEYYQATLDEEAAKHDYWIALVDYIGALGTGNTFYGIASKTVQGVKVQ